MAKSAQTIEHTLTNTDDNRVQASKIVGNITYTTEAATVAEASIGLFKKLERAGHIKATPLI